MKRYFTILLLFISSLLVLNSCMGEPPNIERSAGVAINTNNIVSIGCIGSTDEKTARLIKQLLSAKQINAEFSGSVVYDILVDKKKSRLAQGILKESAELKDKWVKYYNLGDKP